MLESEKRTDEARDLREAGAASEPQRVLSFLLMQAARYHSRTAFHDVEGGVWRQLTYGELAARVRHLSDYVIERGFKPKERIAILSASCPDWAIAFFAAVRCGAVVVPLDTQLTEGELRAIVLDAEPCLMLVSPSFMRLGAAFKEQFPFLADVILMHGKDEAGALGPTATLQAKTPPTGVSRRCDETALVMYTSGTTGAPKGVMISFNNLYHQVTAFEAVMRLTERDRVYTMVPMHHLLGLTCGMLGVLYAGGQVCCRDSLFPHEIIDTIREKRVTCMLTVPLFLKMLKHRFEKDIDGFGVWCRWGYRCALRLAPAVPSMRLKRFAFRAVHARLGRQFRAFITGGAALDPEVADFFDRVGLPVYPGYGLTETGPVIAVNTPASHRRGSVGRPLPGVRVRIQGSGGAASVRQAHSDGVGEILTAGPHVMQGYYRRADWTREAIGAEGWLHTGDLGRIDADGFLYVTGRLKNVIVLSSGKKVSCEEVEAVLSQSRWIQEVLIVGRTTRDGWQGSSEAICAVVVPADDLMSRLQDAALVRAAITRAIEPLARRLAPFKRPSQVVIHRGPFPKTSTRKVKRDSVTAWLAAQEQTRGF